MLGPPEFVRTGSTIQSLTIGQNDDVTFPFRSHTPDINSCHINKMMENTNGDKNQSLTISFNCMKAKINQTDVVLENMHCLYSVTGEAPDFHLTLRVRNMKTTDGGLWSVNISNNEGSDVFYVHVKVKVSDVHVKTMGGEQI